MIWLEMWEAWLVAMTGHALAANRRRAAQADADWLETMRKYR